jgi:membrane protein DedA with SNARE-associated domain
LLSPSEIAPLIARDGYWAVGVIVALESMGIPVPGETTLIAAAIYAGTTHDIKIGLVIAAAAAGGIMGDNVGFWLGRAFGYRLLLRYGRHVGLSERRIKLGQYLFLRHGGKVVFFGRFVPVLRALAAFLAGANRMDWPRFLVFNAVGGMIWASAYGMAAFWLGQQVERLAKPVGVALGLAAVIAIIVFSSILRGQQAKLEQEAERALPGPLEPPGARTHRR